MPTLIVYCACPDAVTADRLARSVVEARLAACVNVLPGIRSTYRWHERVEQADEVLLLIKTQATRLDALTRRLRELHPYELPEVLAVEASTGLPEYLDWVAQQTRDDD